MDPTLHIRLLGGFRLVYGDDPVTAVDSPRLQSLVAYLVLHRDIAQQRRHLAFLLWPDSDEGQARTNLRNLLHHLRRALPAAERYLRLDGQALEWQPDAPLDLDVAAFEAAASAGALEEAAALYTGDLLPDCYDDWVIPERERLQALFMGVLEQLAHRLEQARDYPRAIAETRRLVQMDPLREEPYRDLMRLFALSGDRAAAVHAYHTCADTLQRELGVEPGPAIRQAYERLLSEAEPAGSERAPVTLRGVLPLVGREHEWATLLAAWRAASAGGPRLALVEGEPGIGKTRLAEELVAWAARQGLRAAQASCYAPASTLAYAPVADWLRARPLPPLEPLWLSEVARLLPELLARQPELPLPGPLAEEWQRQRLYAALARAILGGGQPLLLVLDDLHWCDAESLAWLHYLLRYDPQARLLLVATLRPGEAAPGSPLATLLASLRRDGLLDEIGLKPLDQAQSTVLAGHAAGRELEEAEAARLYRETEGNPLFVVETVRARDLAGGGSRTAPTGPDGPPSDRRGGSGTAPTGADSLASDRRGGSGTAPTGADSLPSDRRGGSGTAPAGADSLPSDRRGGSGTAPAGADSLASDRRGGSGTAPAGADSLASDRGGGSGTAPAAEGGLEAITALPPAVRAALAARLEALSPRASELLGVAAVVGREFTFDVLRHASGGEEEALVRALDELWQRRIVRERGQGGYDFSHQWLREVAYGALSAARRRLLHRRVAEALEAVDPAQAEALAYHFEQAGAWAEAACCHRLAGAQARRVYANASALAHLEQALALAERAGLDAALRFDILAEREAVRGVLGEREAQARDLDAMAALARACSDTARLAKVCRRRARLLTDTGRYDEAEAAAREALALAEQAGDVRGRASALVALGTVADLRGEPARAIPHLRAAVEACGDDAAGESGPAARAERRQRARARYALASALLALREYDAARAEAGAALTLYEALDDRLGQAEALNILGIAAMEQGAFDDAIACYRRALETCRAIGYRYGEARALGNWGNILYVRGRLGEALARYAEAAAVFQAIGHRRGEAIVRLNMADIRLTVMGDAEGARADVEAVLAYARQAGERTSEGQSLTILGVVAQQLGDLPGARRLIEASVAVLGAAGEQWLEAQARITLAHVRLDEGQPQAALADLEAAAAMCRERGMASLEGDLLTARGAVLLALGQPEEALAAVERGAEEPGSGVRRTYLAPLVRHRILHALGREADAGEALEQAYQAVLGIVEGFAPEERRACLERQPEFRAIAEAWRAARQRGSERGGGLTTRSCPHDPHQRHTKDDREVGS